MQYKPRVDFISRRLPKDHGPLIVGQENSLESTFGGMCLGGRDDSYDPEALKAALISPCFLSNPTVRSLSYRRDIAGQHLPSALDDYHFNGYPARNSGSSPQWSPIYSPYSDYTLQSPTWAAYSSGAYSSGLYSPGNFIGPGYTPGAIGQERTTPQTPQPVPPHCPPQQRGLAKLSNRQNHDFASGHHNVVDVDRISQGTDVRTTVGQISSLPRWQLIDVTDYATQYPEQDRSGILS